MASGYESKKGRLQDPKLVASRASKTIKIYWSFETDEDQSHSKEYVALSLEIDHF